MKHLFRGIVLLILVAPKIYGQEFTPVKNFELVESEINKSAENLTTIKSHFIQEKHLSFLTEPVVSEGLFRYKKENQLRWEYTKPFQYLILFNGNKIIIKDQKKTNEFDAGSNAVFKQINDLMLGSIKGNLGRNKDFNLSLKESSKQYQLILIPQTKTLQTYISSVEIYFDKSDLAVSTIKIVESTSDFTRIVFKDRKFNEQIDESTFKSN